MTRRTRLYIFSGQPGSGKTCRARSLSRRLHITYIDYDTVVQPLLRGIESRMGVGESRLEFYSSWRDESYATLWAPVIENLELGNDVILSAPLTREVRNPGFFEAFRKQHQLDIEVFAIYLAPSPALHLSMLRRRGSYRDEEVVSDYEKYRKSHDATRPCWDADHSFYVTFDSLERSEELVEELLRPFLK